MVKHMLHDADLVGHYEIMNSYVPRMGIQAEWYRPCITNQRTTRARRLLKIKLTVYWMVYF